MAELEAFHFNRPNSGMEYLDKIIELSFKYSNSSRKLFMLKSFILEQEGNDSLASRIEK